MATNKVLVISEDPALLRFLRCNLDGTEYQIICAKPNGQDLEALVDEALPDFALIDVKMPWMDGIELCLHLRQCSQVPIILLSTWGAGKDRVRGLDLSAEGYLTEPFGISELVARLGEAACRDVSSTGIMTTAGAETT